MMILRNSFLVLVITLLTACTEMVPKEITNLGPAQPRDRELPSENPLATLFLEDVKPLLDKRCVVCHGCYDAPCQLKLSSVEGIDRGFSPELIYDLRFNETAPTRLFIDEQHTQAWRDRGYKPVLNERDQTPQGNLDGSVLYQLLAQKKDHALPDVSVLPDSFDFSLDREQQCPSIETYQAYKKDYPLAGMPYGLPGLNNEEHKVLAEWVKMGSPMAQPLALSPSIQQRVKDWEIILNANNNKTKLVSRYIYEHLFLGHLYFSEETYSTGQTPIYFRLVRSETPPGQAIEEITTRRPYEDPQVTNVYYRLRPDTSTVLTKTHMPYALNTARKNRWNELFFEAPFSVTFLPGYQKVNNPFITFASIPAHLRYQFMLDEAQFTIMGFIKGPVCRGQIALNLIQDNFWVFFNEPTNLNREYYSNFIYQQANNLELPSDYSSRHNLVATWHKYAKKEKAYIKAQKQALRELGDSHKLDMGSVWTGNENAALTVFRNIDSAAVMKGLQGTPPKTAWIINYPVLERIHYLLVAGYDVYGPLRHQLTTRLYMDFLRIESEMSFVTLLPKALRRAEIESWYLGANKKLADYLAESNFYLAQKNSILYKTEDYKAELLKRLKQQHYDALPKANRYETLLNVKGEEIAQLNHLSNSAVQQLSQNSLIIVEDINGQAKLFSLLRHNEHKNVSSLLKEDKMRQPELDSAQIFKGVIDSYPQTIFKLKSSEITAFTKQLKTITDLASYQAVLDNYAIRRTHPEFWQVSDQLHQLYYQTDPIIYGLLDYNRLENR